MTPKKLYSFMIDIDIAEALKAVKAADGLPESEQIRRAVREWLERRGALRKAVPRRAVTRRRT